MSQSKRLHRPHLDVKLFPCWMIKDNVQNNETEIEDNDLSCPGYPPCPECPSFIDEEVSELTPINTIISPCPLCWPPNINPLA